MTASYRLPPRFVHNQGEFGTSTLGGLRSVVFDEREQKMLQLSRAFGI